MKTACTACNAPCNLDMHALVKVSIYRFKVLTIFYPVKTMFCPLGWGKLVLPGFLPTLKSEETNGVHYKFKKMNEMMVYVLHSECHLKTRLEA
jgi:hypothetical protein